MKTSEEYVSSNPRKGTAQTRVSPFHHSAKVTLLSHRNGVTEIGWLLFANSSEVLPLGQAGSIAMTTQEEVVLVNLL